MGSVIKVRTPAVLANEIDELRERIDEQHEFIEFLLAQCGKDQTVQRQALMAFHKKKSRL